MQCVRALTRLVKVPYTTVTDGPIIQISLGLCPKHLATFENSSLRFIVAAFLIRTLGRDFGVKERRRIDVASGPIDRFWTQV